jgi:hypothetical protein
MVTPRGGICVISPMNGRECMEDVRKSEMSVEVELNVVTEA